MSTLVAQTISNGTVSTSSANVIQGSAKAWVNFNGTGTVAIRGSFNVSSITDNGTGDYTVNFTTAMPDTNYSVGGTAKEFDGTNATTVTMYLGKQTLANTMATTFCRVNTLAGVNGASYDCVSVCVQIFR